MWALLVMVAVVIGLGIRFAGAGPEADGGVEFTDRDRESLAS